MFEGWFRHKDFYAKNGYHQVSFKNANPFILIKEIRIVWYKYNNELALELVPKNYPENIALYRKISEEYFPQASCSRILIAPYTNICIASLADLTSLENFIKKVNEDECQIPPEIITEIKNIYFFITKSKYAKYGDKLLKNLSTLENIESLDIEEGPIKEEFKALHYFSQQEVAPVEKHIIPERPYTLYSEQKITLFFDSKESVDIRKIRDAQQAKKIAKLFAEDKLDPNALVISDGYRGRYLLLDLAIKARHPEVFKVALAFGADASVCYEDAIYQSPLEHLYLMREYKLDKEVATSMLDSFFSIRNMPKKSLKDKSSKDKSSEDKSSSKLLDINSAKFSSKKGKTEFKLSNSKSIITILMSADIDLPPHPTKLLSHWQAFYEIFSHYFPNSEQYEYFKLQFGKNKLIELIYYDEKLIGFNSFEMCFPRFQSLAILHCMNSALDKAYRGLKIGSLLGFRLGFCLKELLPHMDVGIFFFSSSFMSLRAAAMYKPYPMYQNKITHDYMESKIIPHFLKPDEVFVREELTSYVNDDTLVESKEPNLTSDNPHEWYFNKYILQYSEEKTFEPRTSPVFFSINEKAKQLFDKSNSKININPDHVSQLAQFFSQLFDLEDVRANSRPYLRSKL